MSDVISQESFDELALYFNGGGHLLAPDARRIAAERARILCAHGLDALQQYTQRTGMTARYYVAPYDTSDLLRTGADALALTGARHELSGMKTPLIDAYILPSDLTKFAPNWILEPAPPERANVILREVSALPRVLRLHVAADLLHVCDIGVVDERAQERAERIMKELCRPSDR
ncbi:hypothetical protein [Rothia sp. HMSC067H10]|uniref:hypothetical protein n=1 Tax=Rothia sp. HMSC067H10 TaxID=1739260 RepID=UPI0008A54CA8|nr:hypothetical protein [Rothia sp. HMSC067H10]OFR98504.1 hypothetical protein HMPREF2756_06180 [Rothia sp. HMSC067H10]